jgi:glycosyltransferase involved in cell wall biosynthesis
MISIIIPVFNEEKNIRLMYYKVKAVINELSSPSEVIFIDDGSTDRTYQILKDIKSCDKKLTIIKFIKNFGQSAALAAAFNIASGDIAVTLDGDLQYDPADINVFLENILNKKADVICGWRRSNKLSLLIKRLPSFIANFIASSIFGIGIHDFSCSFRAYKKDFYKKVFLADGLHRFIPILAKFQNKTIEEIKVSISPRMSGRSKYTYLRFPRVIKDAIFIKICELFFDRSCKYLFKKTNFIIDIIE